MSAVPKPTPLHFFLAVYAGWVNRHQLQIIEYLRAENAVLRQHIAPKRIPFTEPQRLLWARAAKKAGRAALLKFATVAAPDTLLGWYRDKIARKYDGSAKRKPGRPPLAAEARSLIVQLAQENIGWGYAKLAGVLATLGLAVSPSTIRRILLKSGLDPDSRRGPGITWKQFLEAHWTTLAATDFFTVEALTWQGLARLHVLFVIDLETRCVHIAGVVRDPHGRWMRQIARNLLDAVDGFLLGKTHLIMDRDPLFTADFRAFLHDAGLQSVRLPPKSPNLNAYAERFVRSVRQECLSSMIIFGEAHLRRVLREYVEHYNHERPHQGIGNVLTRPHPSPANLNGPIRRKQRLGGLLNYYHRGLHSLDRVLK